MPDRNLILFVEPVVDLRHFDENMTVDDAVAVVVVGGRVDIDCAIVVGNVQVELAEAVRFLVDAVQLVASVNRGNGAEQCDQDGDASERCVGRTVGSDQVGVEEHQGQAHADDGDQDADNHRRPMKADATAVPGLIVADCAVAAAQMTANGLRAGEQFKQPAGKAEQDARSLDFAGA